MSLILKNISKSFGTIEVLRQINHQFEPGQITAIVGDNGAGKSTLLKLITGIYNPDTGSIKFEETELTTHTAAECRQRGIEMVYQDLALAKQQNVIANLWMGRELKHTCFGLLDKKAMADQAQEKLEKLGIQIPDLEKQVGLLSGGQQQAIGIARALLFNPQILLLDEPTAALAAREVTKTLDLIRQQRDQGKTIILVSHRLNDVFAVADQIIVMKQGQIVADTKTSATSLNQIVEKIVS